METNRFKIPLPVSGGLILSYKCSASCRHCMYACSPQWQADWISEPDLENCLSILADKIKPSPRGQDSIGLSHGLHFTGGEPFLNFDLLVKATEIAEALSIPSTFVETNCSWCTNDVVTREKLSLLKNTGLKGIMISVNPFYAEFIPFEKTERCIRLALEIFGNNVFVYQLEFYRLFQQLGIQDTISFDTYLQLTKNMPQQYPIEMFLQGRATYQLKDLYPKYAASSFFDQACLPSFIRQWHNHWDNYGNIMPGFCGGISLGKWQDLNEMIKDGIDLKDRPVLDFLISENMEGLYQFARSLGYKEQMNGYISKCDLCLDIRRFLFSHRDFQELQPKQFYQQIELEL